MIDAGTFAVLWLTARKQPGKICRQAAVSLLRDNAALTPVETILFNLFNHVTPQPRVGTALA